MSTITPPPIIAPPPTLPYATPASLAIPHNWTNPQTFSLDPDQRLPALRRALLLRAAISLITMAVIVAIMTCLQVDISLILTLLVLFAAIQSVSFVSLSLRHRREWAIFHLLLADQGLLVRSTNPPLTRIDASDIREIAPFWDSYRLLLPNHKKLYLPRRFLHPAALQLRLHQLHPLAPPARARKLAALATLNWSLIFLRLALLYVGIFTSNPATSLACAALLVPLVLLACYRITRLRGLPTRIYILAYLNLPLPALPLLHYLTLLLLHK